MLKRMICLLILCLALTSFAVKVLGQDAVKLQYKFTPGELLRYKIQMDMTMEMQMTTPDGSQMPTIPVQMVMVMRQRTKSIQPNGDAEVAVAIESAKFSAMGASNTLPVNKMPVITMIVSPIGEVKGVKGMENLGAQFGQTPFMNPANMGQFNALLPTCEVKVGDTWGQEIPIPGGYGAMKVQGKLLSTDTPVGSYKTATFQQDLGGTFGFNMSMPFLAGDASNPSPSMDMKGDLLANGTISFSPEEGRIIRSDGAANAQASVNIPGAQQGQPGNMKMNIQMKYQMFLLK